MKKNLLKVLSVMLALNLTFGSVPAFVYAASTVDQTICTDTETDGSGETYDKDKKDTVESAEGSETRGDAEEGGSQDPTIDSGSKDGAEDSGPQETTSGSEAKGDAEEGRSQNSTSGSESRGEEDTSEETEEEELEEEEILNDLPVATDSDALYMKEILPIFSDPDMIMENYEYPDGDFSLMTDLYNDGTATIWKIIQDSTDSSYEIPSFIEYDGEEYEVNTLSLSSSTKCPDITFLILPDTLTTITGRFSGIPNLTEFSIPDTVEVVEASFSGCNNLHSITIPGSVSTFEGNFQNCKNLKTITFEEGVQEISGNSLVTNCSALTTINLPSTLTVISAPAAFAGATALEEITLPEGVIFTEGSAFKGCTSLKSITLPASISKIPSNMFNDCTSLKTVIAEGTITEIGSSAFKGAAKLEVIPDLGSVTTMGEYAFYECSYLNTAVDLSNLSSIPGYAFSYTSITSVTFSSQLHSIGDWAFLDSYITKLSFPDTLESIGAYAFCYCYYLGGNLILPDSLTTLETGAFEETAITSLTIGSGLTSIPESAFASCESLTSVTINNSGDNVTVAGSAFPDSVEPVYLLPSIGDVGDTIRDGVNAPTLQEAIDAAEDGTEDIIQISKDIKITSPVTIPAGKIVVLSSKPSAMGGSSSYTITADKTKNLSNLITVEEGAALTLTGDLRLIGNAISSQGSLIECRGQMTLENPVVISRMKLENISQGVINVSGENAEFVMNGGSIEGNTIAESYCGSIRVTDGASLTMNGGEIKNNVANTANAYLSSPGVYLLDNSSFIMNDGSISNNRGCRGSAVYLYTDNYSTENTFIMNGGTISENSSIADGSGFPSSGAVHIEGNSSFILTGDGLITRNRGRSGAGVCVIDPKLQNGNGECQTAFVMNGGIISNNTAGGSGGGIYSYTNHVELNAGEISGNTADQGGGIYSEGNADYYSTLQLNRAIITDNTAEQGGGMWFCPTGEGAIYIADGSAIYNNLATGAGDDIAAATNANHTLSLANRMVGGGSILWYRDGGIYSIGSGAHTSVNTGIPRYGQEGADSSALTIQDYAQQISLKSVVKQTAVELAKKKVTLYITGNKASRGGGIGSNGGIAIGEDDTTLKTITIHKVWPQNAEVLPESITLHLFSDVYEIDTVTLTAADGWTKTLTNIPADLTEFTVTEDPVSGYSMSYEIKADTDGNIIITVTNVKDGDDNGGNNDDNNDDAPTPAYWTPTAQKTLDGNVPSGSNFSFSLKDGNGAVIQTVSNNGGDVDFDEISFDAGGTYTYFISENAGNDSRINYDTASYTAKIVISGSTDLSVESVAWSKNGSDYDGTPIFANTTRSAGHSGGGSSGSDHSPSVDTITVNVSKIWDDHDSLSRPSSVAVQLFQNGEAYGQPVSLSAANAWQHSWRRLDKDSSWTVDEITVPDQYRKSVTNTENDWFITNTLNTNASAGETEGISGQVSPSGEIEGIPGQVPPLSPSTLSQKLPKTGDSNHKEAWLILFVLSAIGVLFYPKIRKSGGDEIEG
ncbi:leucine-rich repeat protein [Clostridium sp. AM58-1XD]|uniref:leucine-rich repeat protein n=1 Tax=Clostridium sp. AM58-1XD TaxID=2292307 RepID=UPI000E5423D1|nr:leucine-rich repeat protein [Clostridium sp. AM58-1XD]RGY96912.1 Cna B-type domain-containing protein [Clostridium sp. AM58-1XD]